MARLAFCLPLYLFVWLTGLGEFNPELLDARLVSGLICDLWHYPVVIAVLPLHLPRLPLWYAIGCFTVSVVGISFVCPRLQIRSASVFPAALLHAMSNAFQGAFEGLTKHGDLRPYVTYEYGIGFALVIPLIAVACWRRRLELPPALAALP